MAGRADESAMF